LYFILGGETKMDNTTTSITISADSLKDFIIPDMCTYSEYNWASWLTPKYFSKNNQSPYSVKSIKFDEKFTTVTWQDGTTTRVGCMLEDEYNRYEAFCAALAKKIYKSTSAVKHIVDTKDEQIEIDKQRKEREAQEKAAQIRKARKDRIWIKKRAKEIALENAAQELAKKLLTKQ